MLLLRSIPDSSGAAGVDELFHENWGRDHCVVWGRSRHADFGPVPHSLSIRAVWGGTQHCHIGGRTVAVDDDTFLILNHGRVYSTHIHATQPVECLSICFKPELIEQVAARPAEFCENLQSHDSTVSPVLRFIRAHLSRGLRDEHWYEEQLLFLLERMCIRQGRLLEHIDSLALVRPATRREAHRRIGLATDFLHTHYAQDADLGTLARMACMSKFHFLRLFTLIHGITPRAFQQRKRVAAAVRLFESTQLTVSEVAAHVGFAHASTLSRQLRRWTRLSPQQVRARVFGPAPAARPRAAAHSQSRRDEFAIGA